MYNADHVGPATPSILVSLKSVVAGYFYLVLGGSEPPLSSTFQQPRSRLVPKFYPPSLAPQPVDP